MITLHLQYHKWVAFLLIVSSDHFNPFPIMFATVKTGILLSQESWTPAEAILVWFLARAGYNLGELTADLQGVRRRNYNGETAYMWRAWRSSVSWSSFKEHTNTKNTNSKEIHSFDNKNVDKTGGKCYVLLQFLFVEKCHMNSSLSQSRPKKMPA